MKIEHTAIATATLLTQLMIGLQREKILSAEAIEEMIRESIALNKQAGGVANADAAKFLEEIWLSVREN